MVSMRFYVILILFGLSIRAYSKQQSSSLDLLEEHKSSTTKVGYEKFLRLNNPQNKTKNSDWLDFSHTYRQSRGSIQGKFSLDARAYLNNQDFSVSPREAYIRYQGENNSTYTLGEQILDWHPNESFWQLDHFQNTRGFRLTDTKIEGLTGFHYKTKDSFLNTEVFLSYFYRPALNPSVKVVNGGVSSNVDWYKRPPEQTIIAGQEVDIFYDLKMPELREVIVQKTLGMRLYADWGTYKNKNRGQISGFYIYKPERRLRINAQAYYDPALQKVAVEANPVVNHHAVYGGEVRQKYRNFEAIAGFVTVDPNAKLGTDFDSLSLTLQNQRTIQSDFFTIEPLYDRESYAHTSITWKSEFSLLSFNYLKYFTEHEKGSDDFYSDTVKWVNAVGLGGSYLINDWLHTTLNLRYDLERQDNLLNAQLIFFPWRQSTVTLGTELIKSPNKNSYWSAYRANDTFYINLAYIF